MTKHFDVLLEWLEHLRNYVQSINVGKKNGYIATSRQSKVFVYMVILEFLTQHGIVKTNLQIIYKFKHLESNNRKATNFLWKKCERVSR